MAVASPGRSAAPPGPGPVASEGRAGRRPWWRAYRHHLRLLRATAAAWTVVLAGIGAGVVATFEDRLPTVAARQAADALEGVPAFEALFGRYVQPGGLEGFVLSRWGMFAIFVAVWGLLAATRLLRGAEEAGHAEPLRAGVLTPRGLLASAVAAMLTCFVVFAAAVGAGHHAAGMDPTTAWALGSAMGLLAAGFAAVGTLASQLAVSRRRASILAGAVLAGALVVRVLAAATATPDWLWWATPLGWVGFLHEADAARPVVLAALTAFVVGVLAAGFALARRDLHGGSVGGEGLSAVQARPVGGQLGLAVRLTGAAAAAWSGVLAAAAFVFALLADDFVAVVADMPDAVAALEQLGYVALDTIEGFVALVLAWFFLLGVALFAAFQATAIRQEEASWRIEHLLARAGGRVRWLATRAGVAAAGLLVVALAVALAVWVGTALGGAGLAARDALWAGLNLLPAALLFLGLGILLFGVLPRLTAPLAYGLVIGAYLLDFAGPLLDLPGMLLDASPFRHLAEVPVADPDLAAAAGMMLLGGLAAGLGIAAFRRRDLREA